MKYTTNPHDDAFLHRTGTGLTKREYMATAIMAGIAFRNPPAPDVSDPYRAGGFASDAAEAVRWADALIAALNTTTRGTSNVKTD